MPERIRVRVLGVPPLSGRRERAVGPRGSRATDSAALRSIGQRDGSRLAPGEWRWAREETLEFALLHQRGRRDGRAVGQALGEQVLELIGGVEVVRAVRVGEVFRSRGPSRSRTWRLSSAAPASSSDCRFPPAPSCRRAAASVCRSRSHSTPRDCRARCRAAPVGRPRWSPSARQCSPRGTVSTRPRRSESLPARFLLHGWPDRPPRR